MELKTEPPLVEILKSKDKQIILGLIIALALSLLISLFLSIKLEIVETNYDLVTQEIHSLKEQNYEKGKKDLAFLKETREVLRECLAVYKANP